MAATVPSDHYTLLGVAYDCAPSVLASAFRSRSRTMHPDKAAASALSAQERRKITEQYLQLQQAYHVLRHAETRQQYDAALQAGGLSARFGSVGSSATSGVLSFNEVDLDDMSYDEVSSLYTHRCRCGAEVLAAEEVLQSGVDLFPCTQCSLLIRVMFEWQPMQEDDDEAAAAAAAAGEGGGQAAAASTIAPSSTLHDVRGMD